ncbi:unnamed protein product [Caretta caretta]
MIKSLGWDEDCQANCTAAEEWDLAAMPEGEFLRDSHEPSLWGLGEDTAGRFRNTMPPFIIVILNSLSDSGLP